MEEQRIVEGKDGFHDFSVPQSIEPEFNHLERSVLESVPKNTSSANVTSHIIKHPRVND
jgi:hypothetical protein